MDINEIRMRNYRDLLLKFRGMPENERLPDHGMLKRFAEFTGVSPRYYSHINNGRKKHRQQNCKNDRNCIWP